MAKKNLSGTSPAGKAMGGSSKVPPAKSAGKPFGKSPMNNPPMSSKKSGSLKAPGGKPGPNLSQMKASSQRLVKPKA